MAKKKSKTQKYKKNQKQKLKKQQTNIQKQTKIENSPSKTDNKPQKEKQLVDKNKVDYNVVLKKEKEIIASKKNKKTVKKHRISEIFNQFKKRTQKETPKKQQKPTNDIKKKNIFFRLLYELKNNLHIIFNSIIIIIFIIMLIGFIRIRVLEAGTIIYICAIILFLMLVAMSYNKYLSGKIFTIILSAGMICAIYHMQYTYDFIRNLNSNLYEYKTYYVVTFDNNSNRSIYNINNKKVGLLKDNCINIERMLNTKLDGINYLEYENINELFNDFYDQKFRAILVNENQYKYLKNNIEENSHDVKILYEFQANAKK